MKKTHSKGNRKRIAIFFLTLLMAGTAIHFGGSAWMEDYIRSVLPDPSSGYDIHWDSLVILPLSRGLRVENLTIEKHSRGDRINASPLARFVLSAHSLELAGIRITSLFSKQGIHIEDLLLKNWKLSASGKITDAFFSTGKKGGSAPPRIRNLRLVSGRMQWHPGDESLTDNPTRIRAKVPLLELVFADNHGMEIKDWMNRIHKGSIGPVQVEIEALKSDIRISRAYLDNDRQSIIMKDFQLAPRYPKYRYSRERGHQTDRIQVSVPVIHAGISPVQSGKSADMDSLFTTIRFQGPRLEIFRDRRLPRKKGTRQRKPFPQQVLRRIPLRLHIPVIHVRDGLVSYAEHLPGSSVPGEVTFSRVSADISDLNVGPPRSPLCPDTRCEIKCLLQELIPTELTFSMEPATPRFRFSGKVSDVALKTMNPLLVPMAFIRIERGRMEGLRFNFNGDHRSIRGTTQARYHDLKLTLLKRRTPPKRRGLATFFMNRLILPHNPSKKSRMRIARVMLERSPGRSFFNWLWRAILDGMKRSAGI